MLKRVRIGYELKRGMRDLSIKGVEVTWNQFSWEKHIERTMNVRFHVVQDKGKWWLYDAYQDDCVGEPYNDELDVYVIICLLEEEYEKKIKRPLVGSYCLYLGEQLNKEVARLLAMPVVKVKGNEYLLVPDRDFGSACRMWAYYLLATGHPQEYEHLVTERNAEFVYDYVGHDIYKKLIEEVDYQVPLTSGYQFFEELESRIAAMSK